MKIRTSFPGLAFALLAVAGAAHADTDRLAGQTTRYDQEYPSIDYSGPARDNRIWRLQQKLDSGEVQLRWEPGFGYLRSLLRALEIDVSSQTLVFSRTSLQTRVIAEQTPRAIYFNDDTYVGFVQNSDLVEFAAVDAKAGVVFFGMRNRKDEAPMLEREGSRCLACHDTFSMKGGGVPRVMVLSAPVDDPLDSRTVDSAYDVDDRTPIAQRWGGWYLSGWYLKGGLGTAEHLGNLPLRSAANVADSAVMKALLDTRTNRGDLVGYFPTDAYLTDTSDVVALLVLEHQTFVQNLITRAQYKLRGAQAAADAAKTQGRRWNQLAAAEQDAARAVLEPLVRAMFFADAAPIEGKVVTSSGYTDRFALRGPQDQEGRSLRDLSLEGRLMRHPLSFMIYSESFNALPTFARDYVDQRIVEVLQGKDQSGIAAKLAAADREAIRQILADTLPRFATLR